MDKQKTSFEKLLDLIANRLQLDCRQYNESYIKRRLNRRIISCNLEQNNYDAYIKILETNAEELRVLFDALTINVTKFFRDANLWGVLKTDVFPKIVDEKKHNFQNIVHIWSCGCSSGEEPYTIAMLLLELAKDAKIFPQIIATDIDKPSLSKAKEKTYDLTALSETPAEYILKYFKRSANNIYTLDDSVARHVSFRQQNILNRISPDKNFDVIFCRNVIIYFTRASKDILVEQFYNALAEHGWLVIGKSEILFTDHLKHKFYLYNEAERIYRKERRKKQGSIEVERRKNWWYGYAVHVEHA